ncbi:MAG: type II toxin-antitoxin system prevent-host-death family antitoxin [Chloroflexota bacterium]|nr:type II toxin-antitoxin system prevent-host-death family antitoxin [Chloroflexota bacterium]
MGEREPVTEMVKASEARQQWSQLLNWVFRKGTHMIVEKSGIPVAAIVSADDLRRPERLEAERAADLAILDEMQDTVIASLPSVRHPRRMVLLRHQAHEGRAHGRRLHRNDVRGA